MADNYIEKRMQDHAKCKPKPFRPLARELPCVPAVVIACADSVPLPDGFCIAARTLCEAGTKVALIIGDAPAAKGQAAAQRLGARYLPFSRGKAIEYVHRTWGSPDMVLCAAPQGCAGAACHESTRSLAECLARIAHSSDFTLEPYNG